MKSILMVVVAASSALAQSVSLPRVEFPLEKGVYWDYAGLVARGVPGVVSLQQRAVTWRMEITDVVKREYWITAAVLRGHPRDLISLEPDRAPGVYLLVKAHQKHYLLSGDRVQAVQGRLTDAKDPLEGLVREDELILESPLYLGQRFCETPMLTRTDGLRCWYIDEERTPSVTSIRGIPPGWDGPEYVLSYSSPESKEIVGFASGIGITSYDYSHEATRSYVQLKLTAFGRTDAR